MYNDSLCTFLIVSFSILVLVYIFISILYDYCLLCLSVWAFGIYRFWVAVVMWSPESALPLWKRVWHIQICFALVFGAGAGDCLWIGSIE